MTHPYATEAYARSLPHLGEPVAVPAWESCMLSRPLPGTGGRDATGPYPLTVIAPDADLHQGFETLAAAGAISLVTVLTEGLRPDLAALETGFDICRPFKTHYLHSRSLGDVAYGKHHRYELRRARSRVEVMEIALADHLRAWIDLYGALTAKHGLKGLHDFPRQHHETLATLQGVRTFAAFVDGRIVSAHIFVTHEGHAISHLAASSAEGYSAGAAYAVNDLALQCLTDCRLINFGGGAGAVDDANDGLARFKRGFSNIATPSYLCCKVLDVKAYSALSAGYGRDGFFPAYRGKREQDGR